MEIELRDFQAKDKAYLWEIYVHALKNYVEKMWGWDQSWQESRFEKGLSKYQTKLIYCDGNRCGYIQLEQMDNSLDVTMLILEPAFQSKGIGSKVLDMLQPKEPHVALTLNCFQVNEGAYRLYLSCGFKVLRTDEKFIYMQRALESVLKDGYLDDR